MKYFNGFSLNGEKELFKEYLIDSEFSVAGFSYGAIEAFEYVYSSRKRVDRLILLSPAIFQNYKKSFMRVQLRYFNADKNSYIEQFLKNVSYPSNIDLKVYLSMGTSCELEALLSYIWDRDRVKKIIDRGIEIEVFLGGYDKIIDSQKTYNFFDGLATIYFIKNVGHILK